MDLSYLGNIHCTRELLLSNLSTSDQRSFITAINSQFSAAEYDRNILGLSNPDRERWGLINDDATSSSAGSAWAPTPPIFSSPCLSSSGFPSPGLLPELSPPDIILPEASLSLSTSFEASESLVSQADQDAYEAEIRYLELQFELQEKWREIERTSNRLYVKFGKMKSMLNF